VQKFFGYENPQFHQLSSWLVSDYPAGEGSGLVWLHMVYSCWT
jgi:hypothetical protein